MSRLTYAERQRLPSSAFVYPRTRRYPIEDASHGRNAIARAHQFGSPGTIRTVEAAVHRRYPEIERHNPDLVADAILLAMLVGGGLLAYGWFKRQSGGAPASPAPKKDPVGPNVSPTPTPDPSSPGPANSVHFNATDTTVYWTFGVDNVIQGHAGFGHTGPGGAFIATMRVRSSGVLGTGLAAGDWSDPIWQQPLQLGNDADWTGYGWDFSNLSVGGIVGGVTGFVSGVHVLFSVDDGSGTVLDSVEKVVQDPLVPA